MNYEIIVPLVALIAGWFINNNFKKKHEIAKKNRNESRVFKKNYVSFIGNTC